MMIRAWSSRLSPAVVSSMPRRPRFKSETPSAASRPLIRALADAKARWARSAPRVMLRSVATAITAGDQIETHGDCPGSLPSSWPKARSVICRLCPEIRSVNLVGMFEPLLILIAAAFLLAGFIKGVIGMGLPTVAMGLLAVTMQPSHALAIAIVPAVITNIWQTFVGPYLRDIIRRLC